MTLQIKIILIRKEKSVNPIGERLREIRKSTGRSCAEMAKALEMSTQRYWGLENGENCKTFEKLPKIAKVLGCRIDDLFPEMDEVKTARADGFEDDSLDDFEM